MARVFLKVSGVILISACWWVIGCSSIHSQDPATTLNHDQLEGDTAEEPGSSLQRAQNDSFNLDWPVDEARLTQRFHPFTRRRHLGIDLAGPRGSHILAAQNGTVVYTGRAFHGYGRLIIIEQNDHWATFYSHLQKILVHEGQLVQRGQLIGLMGRSGNARGVHLHFELRNNHDPVDPLRYLPGGQAI